MSQAMEMYDEDEFDVQEEKMELKSFFTADQVKELTDNGFEIRLNGWLSSAYRRVEPLAHITRPRLLYASRSVRFIVREHGGFIVDLMLTIRSRQYFPFQRKSGEKQTEMVGRIIERFATFEEALDCALHHVFDFEIEIANALTMLKPYEQKAQKKQEASFGTMTASCTFKKVRDTSLVA